MGVISLHGEEILISRKEMCLEYIAQRIRDEFEADSSEDNDAMFTGMQIAKNRNEVPHGISMETHGYEDKIKSIEISHARTSTPHEPLTESELSILRTELGKLTSISRMARPYLIYDVAAAAQVFSKGGILAGEEDEETSNEETEKEEGGKDDLAICPDL